MNHKDPIGKIRDLERRHHRRGQRSDGSTLRKNMGRGIEATMTPKSNSKFIAEARAICAKATPPHDEDQPDETCAACGDIPDTRDREWDRGDLCWTCQADVFNPLRTALPEALDRLEKSELAQEELKKAGWKHVAEGGKDFCPKHKPRRKPRRRSRTTIALVNSGRKTGRG